MRDGSNPLERNLEKQLVRRVKALGGFAPKSVWPGETGGPDRCVMMPDGWLCWVEMKRPTGGVKSKRQVYIHEVLTDLQQHVVTLWTQEDIDQFIKSCMDHQRKEVTL